MNFKQIIVAAATALTFIGCYEPDLRDKNVIDSEKRDHEQLDAERYVRGQAAADYFKAAYDSAITMDSGRISTIRLAIPSINSAMSQKFNAGGITVSGRLSQDEEDRKTITVVTATDRIGRRTEYKDAVRQGEPK